MSGGWDKFIHMWDIETGAKLVTPVILCDVHIAIFVSGQVDTITWLPAVALVTILQLLRWINQYTYMMLLLVN